MTSVHFASFLERISLGKERVLFFIGAYDGFPDGFAQQCQYRIAFGQWTWPHLWVRVLLLEQLYRTQQRALNHPYSFV